MSEAPADPVAPSALRRSVPYRLKAAGIHMAISVAIFGVALYLILVQWYPGFHFRVDGGWQGVRIMAAVDLVLGPTLTLVIFNPFKARRLIVFDLSCIALAQLAALVWGFYAVHSQRPVSVNYYEGAFLSMTVEPLKIEKHPADFANQFSERRPPLVYVREPADDQEEARAAMQEVMGQVGLYEDPFFFRRLDEHWAQVRQSAATAEKRSKENAPFAEALSGFLARHGGQPSDYLFFPYVGRDGDCTLAFRPAGELVDALGCKTR